MGLNKLLNYSNFRFNINYVLNNLVQRWVNEPIKLSNYYQYRNWKYIGGDNLTRDEFVREKNNDIFRCKLNIRLLGLKDALAEDRFIDIETDLGLSTDDYKGGYKKVVDLVREYNKDYIGASKIDFYFRNLEIQQKVIDFISCREKWAPHIDNIYRLPINVDSQYSISFLSKELGVGRGTLSNILNFEPNKDTKSLTERKVNYWLKNINRIETIKANPKEKRNTDFHIKEVLSPSQFYKEYAQSLEDVFKPLEELEVINTDKLALNQKEVLNYEIKYLKLINETSKYDEEQIQVQLENSPNRVELVNSYIN